MNIKENDFDDVVDAAIKYWIGKENNPLNEKTFREIYNLAKSVGIENIK